MEDGWASKGVPQWIYEEGKIDIEDHVNFYTDPFSQYVSYNDADYYDGYGQFGGAVCEVCQVNEVENLGYGNMCRVCEAAAYSAESAELSEAQFVGGDPNIHGDFLTEGVQLFCQRCAASIVSGDYCNSCAQLLGVPFLSEGASDM